MLDEGTTKIEVLGKEIEFKNELALADIYAIGLPPIDFVNKKLIGGEIVLIRFFEKCLSKLAIDKKIKWHKIKPSVMFKFTENKKIIDLIMNTFIMPDLPIKTDDIPNQKKNLIQKNL